MTEQEKETVRAIVLHGKTALELLGTLDPTKEVMAALELEATSAAPKQRDKATDEKLDKWKWAAMKLLPKLATRLA